VSIQATGITPNIEVALARIEELEGGTTREENLKGALDKNINENDASDPDNNAAAKNTTEEVDQSKIDYQLARALDLLQGVAIFTKDKATQ
jgi:carboxyl-terminal processing protease